MFFLGVDKPKGWTSHDVVNLLRILTGIRRIGHTGTLDPFATGVLVLAFQDATKLIGHLPSMTKRYQCTLQLGQQTETADCTGDLVSTAHVPVDFHAQILQRIPTFVGEIVQTPPKYSAIKVNGRRLYEYARAGQSVEIPSRKVHIAALSVLSDLEIGSIKPEQIALDMTCSKGTYVRSLGCDLAASIGTVGYLETLQRLSSDGVDIVDCVSMADLAEWAIGTREHDWRLVLSKEGRAQFPRCDRSTFIDRMMPYSLSVERMFNQMPAIVLGEEESLWLARGRCIDRLRQRTQGLGIVQGIWNDKQLGIISETGKILRVNPSIASLRLDQSG